MKRLTLHAIGAVLILDACLLVGCGSSNQQPSSDNSPNPAMSGGNGTMGETPAHQGSYGNQAPATQPSGS
jgi:hypothetical protein